MKLQDIPEGSLIKVQTSNSSGKLGDYVIFHHCDGMYSYCTVVGNEKEVVHISRMQELKLVDDHYELA